MNRPYGKHYVWDLEQEFETHRENRAIVRAVRAELDHRKKPRALRLRTRIDAYLNRFKSGVRDAVSSAAHTNKTQANAVSGVRPGAEPWARAAEMWKQDADRRRQEAEQIRQEEKACRQAAEEAKQEERLKRDAEREVERQAREELARRLAEEVALRERLERDAQWSVERQRQELEVRRQAVEEAKQQERVKRDAERAVERKRQEEVARRQALEMALQQERLKCLVGRALQLLTLQGWTEPESPAEERVLAHLAALGYARKEGMAYVYLGNPDENNCRQERQNRAPAKQQKAPQRTIRRWMLMTAAGLAVLVLGAVLVRGYMLTSAKKTPPRPKVSTVIAKTVGEPAQ